MEWGTDDLRALELDLKGSPRRVQSRSARALAGPVGRRLVREMKVDATGHKGNWFGRPGTSYRTPLEKHVTHEMVGPFEVEAGIEAKGAGKLGHLIAYGGPRNGPAYDPGAGPRRALPHIEKMLADTAEESMLGDQQ